MFRSVRKLLSSVYGWKDHILHGDWPPELRTSFYALCCYINAQMRNEMVRMIGLQYHHVVTTPDGSLQCWQDSLWPLSDGLGLSGSCSAVSMDGKITYYMVIDHRSWEPVSMHCVVTSMPRWGNEMVRMIGLQYHHVVTTPDGSLQCWQDSLWPLSDEGTGEQCSPPQATKQYEWAARTLRFMSNGVVKFTVDRCHVTVAQPSWTTIFSDWVTQTEGWCVKCFAPLIHDVILNTGSCSLVDHYTLLKDNCKPWWFRNYFVIFNNYMTEMQNSLSKLYSNLINVDYQEENVPHHYSIL